VDERIRRRGARDHVGLLSRERLEHGAVRGHARPRPYEGVAGVTPPERRREPARLEARARVGGALERAERRLHEELRRDERRHRVAGQPEHERAAADAERDRLAGLHGDAPEDLLDAELGLDPPDEIVRPHRDAARGDEDVRGQRALERGTVGRLVVGDRRLELDVGADGGERGREHEPVRLVDLTSGERPARRDELAARREDRDTRPAAALDLHDAGGREGAELRGAEADAGRDDLVAASHVAAARADVRARFHGLRDLHSVVILDNILDGDDGIRARGDDGAGRDLDRLAGTELEQGRPASRRAAGDGERAGHVGGANGEAVHRRARERRQVDSCTRTGRRHSPVRRGERNELGLGRRHAREHEHLRLLDGE